jgi:hypothetical protein
MLFRVVDHYNVDLNEKSINNEKIECFICYETIIDDLQPIKLNSNNYYIKKCNCNGFIHKNCLDIWYSKNKKCPVCREFMCDNTIMSVSLFSKGRYILFFYIIIKKNIVKIIRVLTVWFLILSTCEFYLSLYYNHFYEDNK